MNSSYLTEIVKRDLTSGSEESSHIYCDLNIINNDNGNLAPVPLHYSDTRDKPIIQDPSEYNMSIVRFYISTLNLPVMIPQIQNNNGNSDPNLTIYSFTMQYQSVSYQYFLRFVPQDLTAKAPKLPVQYQDLSTGYYFLYSYAWFVDIINLGLDACFQGFQNALSAAHLPVPPTNTPFFM